MVTGGAGRGGDRVIKDAAIYFRSHIHYICSTVGSMDLWSFEFILLLENIGPASGSVSELQIFLYEVEECTVVLLHKA